MTTQSNPDGIKPVREPKRALGRGLSALIATPARTSAEPGLDTDKSNGVEGTGELRNIPLLNISLNPFQPRERFLPEQLTELTESIRQHGVLQPVVVRPKGKNTYELIAGERRFRASTNAGLSEIPAIVKNIDNRTSLAIALIENIQRQELNPIESARAYRRLMSEFGLNQTELALEIGKSQPSIANSLRILALPEPILDSISSGEITEGHAKVLLSVENEAQRIGLWKTVVKSSLSVREAERRAAALKSTIPRGIAAVESTPTPSTSVDQEHLEHQLSLKLGTKVRLRFTGREKGHIEIQFYDLDQLEGLISTLSDKK